MRCVRIAMVSLALAAAQAHAGMFDDEEARKSIAATQARLDGLSKTLDARMTTLEQQSKQLGFDLLRDLEGIKSDIAKIRGQIEVLTYELNEQQKRQRDLYVDLDTRMRKLETTAAAVPAAPAGAPAAAADPTLAAPPNASASVPSAAAAPGGGLGSGPGAVPGGPTVAPAPGTPSSGTVAGPGPAPRTVDAVAEQRAYDAALDQFKRGDYGGAIASFNAFVRTYPRSPLASSAQYWVGNAQYARRDYRGAITTQRQLLQQFPDSTKAPDALLNIASAQSDLNESTAARRTLEDLIARYPQSEAAGKARQRLGQR